MKKALFFILFNFFNLLLLSAQSPEVQQLLKALKESTDPVQKVDLNVQIAEKWLPTDAKKAQNYGEDALKLIRKLTYPAGENKALIVVGKAFMKQNRWDKSITHLEKAVPWAEQNKDTALLFELYELLAQAHQRAGNNKEVALYREKYHNLEERQANLANQNKIKTLEEQFSSQKDSVSLARLAAIQAQAATDSALNLVSQKEAALLRQSLQLANLEKEAARIEQEKLQSQLQLVEVELEKQKLAQERQRLYSIIWGFALLLVIGLSGWFYYQSRQARKLAKLEHLEAERLRILTAGIAHEIKNPLNFVNNFAEGSVEIADELEDALANLKSEQMTLITELVSELKQNSVDIRKNGQRVHQIVRSMTDYASGEKNARQATDLNQLLDENINLAYHGYRAQHPDFIANIERKYDPALKAVELIPQDMGRVLLNIVNNACYALHQKRKETGAAYTPTLTVSTWSQNGEAIVQIRDNGIGIPKEVRDKIFTPFFTTKPTGTGNTGLGLSISREIVVQNHHGKLEVESSPGDFTEFTIRLPKKA